MTFTRGKKENKNRIINTFFLLNFERKKEKRKLFETPTFAAFLSNNLEIRSERGPL